MSDKELQRKIIQLLKENNSEMELNEVCSLLGITSTELNEVLDNLAGL
jgi:predicted Zn-ribbon and HTH transcriptional regulator